MSTQEIYPHIFHPYHLPVICSEEYSHSEGNEQPYEFMLEMVDLLYSSISHMDLQKLNFYAFYPSF